MLPMAPLVPQAPSTPVRTSQGRQGPRGRQRKKNAGRVHWDEQQIAEHDKERGTRQKIDEPDTPYVRSPQAASDSEGEHQGDEEEQRRLSIREAPCTGAGAVPPPQPLQGNVESSALAVETLASRLDLWVKSGAKLRRPSNGSSSAGSCDGFEYAADTSRHSSACSSRSSSNASKSRRQDDAASFDGGSRRCSDRRISLPEDSIQPKPSSATFKAKRAQHYNEVAALKARPPESDTSDQSDTSEENEQTATKTNTNTNVNATISKALEKGIKEHVAEAVDAWSARPSTGSVSGAESGASSEQEREIRASGHRDRVSFTSESAGEESSEEFRQLRRNHYAREWKQDRLVPVEVSSLETNTNTNLNAGHADIGMAPLPGSACGSKNPMEAGRPPVQFAGEPSPAPTPPSAEFQARRLEHYDEVAALRRYRAEHTEDEEEEANASDDEEAAPANEEHFMGALPSRGPAAESTPPSHLPNPMEPREHCLAFEVDGGGSPAAVEGAAVEGISNNAATNADEWRARRQAHYSEMAAALRARPPDSDDDDDEDEDD